MSLRPASFSGMATPNLAELRAETAERRNRLYVRAERFLARLSSANAKKILVSGKPAWFEDIKSGFDHLPHQVEFGSITEDSFRRYDIVVPLSLDALEETRRYSPRQKILLPVPSVECVLLCDDKYEFNQALVKLGFGQYIPGMKQGVAFAPPYILKKRI